MRKRLRKKNGVGEFAPPEPLTAYQRIGCEVFRQRSFEGYSAEHDDTHVGRELEKAGDCYARGPIRRGPGVPAAWPWDAPYWKPTPQNRERELVKAGALYAAELERYNRLEASLHARSRAISPPVRLSVYDLEASKLSQPYERVSQKLAAVETELNQRLLRRLVPTRVGTSKRRSGLAVVWAALQQLGRPQPGSGQRWHPRLEVLQGGGREVVLNLWEYPHCYDFDARWRFDKRHRLVSFQTHQGYPKPDETLVVVTI